MILASCGFKQGQHENAIQLIRRNAGIELRAHQPETTPVRTDGPQQTDLHDDDMLMLDGGADAHC